MQTARKPIYAPLALITLVVLTSAALAAEPGLPYPPTSEVSDQKLGSVLIFKAYTSSPTAPHTSDTQFSIVNTTQTSAAFVHLFFVDGSNCSVADIFICLTPCQIACFLASDIDPGVSGYMVAVAVDGVLGCPVSHNHLTGSARVKYTSGHEADLGAEAFAALYTGILPDCNELSVTADIRFDGIRYNRAPRVLVAEPLLSPSDASQLLIIDRVGGNLATGLASIGTIFAIISDDAEIKYSTSFFAGCQYRADPRAIRTVPPFTSILPPGRCGWMEFWAAADVGMVGALLTTYTSGPLATFSSGKNLVKKTLTASAFYTVPVISPPC